MSKLFILLIFLIGINCTAQDKIIFTYDTAGNQIERELCINCPLTGKKVKDSKEITKEDLITSEVSDEISYYPNPVKEELYLTWELVNDKTVSSIGVYAINGQTLQSFQKRNKVNTQTIPFQSYPTGVYTVVLMYSNGEQKSIKIIKK
ncbi:T9SS type A sorting domain-containing protein [Flavobacterium magnesitis]|uniref:T9SS type A sorting domain-containing protein n=1 Tax=Flavobacterium magnesitis TaxID=3138077 RepID=UPI00358F4AB8